MKSELPSSRVLLSYSYWFIDRDFDDLSNGDYSQQSIALIAIIFVPAVIALLIPFAECLCRMCTSPLIFSNIWVFLPSVDIKSCRGSNLKCWLWTQVYGLEIVCHKVSLSSFENYSMPSISVGRKTAEWQLEVIISASPRPLAIPCVSPSMR